jgi:hypothetical protein
MSALKVLRLHSTALLLRTRIDVLAATAARAVATTPGRNTNKPAEDKSYGEHLKGKGRLCLFPDSLSRLQRVLALPVS